MTSSFGNVRNNFDCAFHRGYKLVSNVWIQVTFRRGCMILNNHKKRINVDQMIYYHLRSSLKRDELSA